jgi:regulatory factor X, other
MDISDKTPTSNNLMASAQQAAAAAAVQRGSNYASIRRHAGGMPDSSNMAIRPGPAAQTAQDQMYGMHGQQRSSVRMLPGFPTVDEAIGSSSNSVQAQVAREVWGWFELHLDTLLDSIKSFKFEDFEKHVKQFWQNLAGDHREVVHAPAMAGLMSRADAMIYDVREIKWHQVYWN